MEWPSAATSGEVLLNGSLTQMQRSELAAILGAADLPAGVSNPDLDSDIGDADRGSITFRASPFRSNALMAFVPK